MRLSSFLFIGSHALESCNFEQGITLTCSLSDLSIDVAQEQPGPCQLVMDNFGMYRVDIESDDGSCRIWDGTSDLQSFSVAYNDKCLSMVNGAIAGQLHLRKSINDKEYEVDQPMSLSCSPTTYTLEESYSIVDDPTEAGHLHRTIQADGRSIKIYDLSTHQETNKITRGHIYQAVISLGDKLYDGFDMVVDRCQIFDENGVVFETVVEDDAVHSHLINHVQKSEELTLGANSAHTHYAFDFNGMSRLGAKIFRLRCDVTIAANIIEPTMAPIAHMTEPERFDE